VLQTDPTKVDLSLRRAEPGRRPYRPLARREAPAPITSATWPRHSGRRERERERERERTIKVTRGYIPVILPYPSFMLLNGCSLGSLLVLLILSMAVSMCPLLSSFLSLVVPWFQSYYFYNTKFFFKNIFFFYCISMLLKSISSVKVQIQ
jgi:hypothetical protein